MAGNSFLTLSWRWMEKEKKGDILKKIQTATQVSFLPLSSFSLFDRVLHVLRSPWSQVAAVFTWSAVWLSACTLCNRLHRPQAVCARVGPFLNRLIEKEFKQEAKRRKNKLKERERERVGAVPRANTARCLWFSVVDDSLITQMSELLRAARGDMQVLHNTADTYVSPVVCLRWPCTWCLSLRGLRGDRRESASEDGKQNIHTTL